MSGEVQTKMNPVVKAMWLEDLRSGNFKQGTGLLHRDYGAGPGHMFCCLGVLSERAVAEGVCERGMHSLSEVDPSFRGVGNYVDPDGFKAHHVLSPAVRTWAGLDAPDPYVTINGRRARISQFNDEGATFEQIAYAIEEQL